MKGYIIEYVVVENIGDIKRTVTKRGIFRNYDIITIARLFELGAVEHKLIREVNTTKFYADIDKGDVANTTKPGGVNIPKLTKPSWYNEFIIAINRSELHDNLIRKDILGILDNLLVKYYSSYNNTISKNTSNKTIKEGLRELLVSRRYVGRTHLVNCIDNVPDTFSTEG